MEEPKIIITGGASVKQKQEAPVEIPEKNKSTFTPDQQDAMDVQGRNILVSAAAGSGKTHTLTHRIIENILTKNSDISRTLVVTFTRAAAGELKDRISSSLMDAIAKHPENRHLQNQILLLGDADICTIDSFLTRPVRENFEKLGLPVSMRVANESEIISLKQRLICDVMNSLYEEYGICGDLGLADIDLQTPYSDLIILLGKSSKDATDTIPFLIKLHSKLITTPQGVELLHEYSHRLREDSKKDFLQTLEGKRIIRELRRVIEGGIVFYDSCLSDVACDEILRKKYLPAFESDKTELCALLKSLTDGYFALGAKLSAYPSAKLGSMSSNDKTPFSERVRTTRKEIVDDIKYFKDTYFQFSEQEIENAYIKTAELTDVLYTLLSEFDIRLMSEKQRLGLYEFSDMPRYMLRLLLDDDGKLSDTGKAIAEKYDEIYIDEYQDVNEIQDKIFELISRNNRFMVGDIKQSIYGFRDAEPKFFTHYRNTFPKYDKNSDLVPFGSTIFMSENFRSDKTIIDFSNTICAPMFYACGEDISYTPFDDLKLGKSVPDDYVPKKVQVDIIGKGDIEDAKCAILHANTNDISSQSSGPRTDGLSEEAVLVANQIAELIRNGKKSDKSPIFPCDIAILVRQKSSIDSIGKALKNLNIEYLVASKSELIQSPGMVLLSNLCSIIDNPRNDVPLCNVITSALLPESFTISLANTVAIRNFGGRYSSLYDALCAYGDEGEAGELDSILSQKCRSIKDRLSHLRSMSVKLSVDKFLKVLASDDIFSSICEGEAFKLLFDSACTYTKNMWGGLSGFVRYFEDITEHSTVGGEIRPVKNAVNIITMHYSKGLQYNTCFVFDCGKLLQNKSLQNSLIYDKDLCIGMKLPEKAEGDINTLKRDNIIYRAVTEDIKSKDAQEAMRVLYVALTRAKERLYVSGTIGGNSTFSSFFKKFNLYGISDYSTVHQSCPLGWVTGAICAPGHDKSSYDITLHSVYNNTPLCEPFGDAHDTKTVISANPNNEKYASILCSLPTAREEEKILSAIPSKVAASKVSERMLDESVFSDIPTGILFSQSDEDAPIKQTEKADNKEIIRKRIELMRSQPLEFDSLIEVNKKPTATERGTAMHAFLQYCDYRNIRKDGLKNEISRLVREQFISERTADILNIRQLDSFFKSAFFDTLLNAKNVRREFKFGMFRSAAEFTQNKELSQIIEDRKIFVQGSVDLLIENPDGSIYLCDYKTDRISPEEMNDPELLRAHMTEAHKEQLDQYSYAIQKIFGKKPDKTFIFSLAYGNAVEIL